MMISQQHNSFRKKLILQSNSLKLKTFFFLSVILFSSSGIQAFSDPGEFSYELFKAGRSSKKTEKLAYRVYSPKLEGSSERIPLLVVLLPAGISEKKYSEMWKDSLRDRRYILLIPERFRQSPNTLTRDVERLDQLVKYIKGKYPIDEKNLFIQGTSLGAFMAQALVALSPQDWRGVSLVSTGTSSPWIHRKDLGNYPPVFYIQGKQDPYCEKLKLDIELEKKQGLRAELMIDETAAHDHRPEWNQKILEWFEKIK